jgi:pimeloyl-ACP methyl ester carboxylesterase
MVTGTASWPHRKQFHVAGAFWLANPPTCEIFIHYTLPVLIDGEKIQMTTYQGTNAVASYVGPMMGAVMRCVADNVEDVIIQDCGHWITEEQPAATTKLVVDFLHRCS